MSLLSHSASLRSRVLNHDILVGTFLNLGSPLAAEACALADFDWLLIDLEHGFGGEEALLGQLLAAAAHAVPALVRVETDSRIRCGHALDLGAAGIMFPRLDTARQVQEAICHLRYPPEGDRGVATYNRSCGFGRRAEALRLANERVLGIVQIESRSSLAELSEIATHPGVDALFVGPADLSHALGVPGDYESPVFQSALQQVLEACSLAGIAAGLLAGSPEAAQRYISDGFTFVGLGSDSSFLATAAANATSTMRSEPS
jgi:2-keto-3-deoxy-L-rhamnonate aldolase RhmA